MDHGELLIQIEEMLDRKLEEKLEEKLDKKFDEKLQPIHERLTSVEQKVDSLETKVDSLEVIPKLDALYEDRISHAEFSRLSERVDKNTEMLLVMKDVIIDHSGEIRRLEEVK